MPMADDTTRAELLAARETLKRQIEVLENPMRRMDVYPQGIAKLRATLAEIEDCLAQIDAGEADKSPSS